jgi:hypothetical protein
MNCIFQFLSTYAAAISAIATVVIAVFSCLTWWVSHRIHQATENRDKEIKEILINLTASAMVKERTVGGSEDLVVESFHKIRNELKKLEL